MANTRRLALAGYGLLAVGALVAAVAWLLHQPDVAYFGRWVATIGLLLYAIARRSLTAWILVAMLIGAEIGYDWPAVGRSARLLSQIFLRLIKTIIAPLLFATLVVGIAGHSNLKQVGRMGIKALLYFEVVTTIALFLGLAAINLTKAGVGVTPPTVTDSAGVAGKPQTAAEAILNAFPENVAKAVADGHVLQIVVFSVLFGIALALVPDNKRQPVLTVCGGLAEVMFKFTKLVMYFAPIGVGAAMAYTVGHMGLDIVKKLFFLLATLYVALIAFLLFVLFPVALIARVPLKRFLKAIAEPVSIAFATTSSEAALPLAMERMEQLGVPRQIVAFVMPAGYSFNLDGSTLYLALATIFVAQAAGIHFSFGHQLAIVFTLMLTSKGVAGVPRATLVILLGTAASFGLPEWPILAIMGIDELMDMARTSVNVIGNCLATVVIARWEGEFKDAPAPA
ncbi:MAG TPA: cation:dicarboxylase symporter family transporter [Gemmatimonadales bacterium]|nr:cation:dicarboxylase symporter family transporter [Gemmatimonadales bacterium]